MGVQIWRAEPHRITKSIEEHAEILAALRGGDAEAAAAVVRSHVGRVQAIVRGEER
jgi:DNA-binding GntR family transcriptional regulator